MTKTTVNLPHTECLQEACSKDVKPESVAFPLKFKRQITLMSTPEIILKKVQDFRQLCTPHFSFDKAWTKGRALYMQVDESRLICLRTKSRKLPKAHVVLCSCGAGMTVTVVTKDDRFTACDAHNLVVEAFIEECLTDGKIRVRWMMIVPALMMYLRVGLEFHMDRVSASFRLEHLLDYI